VRNRRIKGSERKKVRKKEMKERKKERKKKMKVGSTNNQIIQVENATLFFPDSFQGTDIKCRIILSCLSFVT
jgi:hypothetical protein